MAEPLYRLTKKATPWKWEDEEQATFEQLKNVLSSDQVLVHFDPNKTLVLACDASNVGIGAVLVHRYPDGSERPIANMSKTLTAAERNCSQIHKEALSIVFGLKKFYQYLYGRPFILVTDHKPLTALFGPKKGTPLLAANRLARWALWLNQFDYTIEYRKTADHGNADALSRLPSGDDINFNREESGEDMDMVCAIKVLSLQIQPVDANILRQESQKDPVISTVMRYVREHSKNHQRTLRPTTKSASSRSCRTHSVPVTDVSSMDLELWFHRACSPTTWIFCISDTLAWNEWSSWQEPLSTGPVLMPLLRWLADDVIRVANTRTSHLSLQFTHGCYQKSLGVVCTWIMQSTSWVKIGWWSRMLTPSIHAFIQRHPHPPELL